MAWVITSLCIDCLDTACVRVCPVDCIYEYVGRDRGHFPRQLYINPDECINCGACEPECPWQAIYEEPAVPALFAENIELNRKVADLPDEFQVKAFEKKEAPTPAQVAANKARWGLSE